MNNRIKILAPDVINKIAAGEVVERPASIVKEFLENAIDAQAHEIILTLEKSGLDAISVSDNGFGMNEAEAQTAVLQHATSKISTAADLFNISTLGFRGEALASIASVATLTIETYDNKSAPVFLTATSAGVTVKPGQGRAQGTTIRAADIFATIPVRRKFLKSEATEYRYILETFTEIALANPGVGLKLIKNGKQVLHYPPAGNALERILQVSPQLKRSDLIPLSYNDTSYLLNGYLVNPESNNRLAAVQYLFVNGRYIRNTLVNKAVKEGYGTALMREMQPGFFIFLKLDPETVDVNVHPRKLEVRFKDTGKIFSIIKRTVETTLTKEMQADLHRKFRDFNQSSTAKLPPRAPIKTVQQSLDFTRDLLQDDLLSLKTFSGGVKKHTEQQDQSTNIKLATDTTPANAASWQNNDFLQVFDTYLITSQGNKVLFIDQHAAAERVNFERITMQLESNQELASQELLIPEKLTFNPAVLANIKTNLELFRRIGYKLSGFDHNSCEIIAIPVITIGHEPTRGFMEIVNDLQNIHQQDYSSRWREVKDKLIATLACHASIRAGEHLMAPVIKKLIADLFSCVLPYSCPHGRPIIWELDRYQLEKNFKRKL